MTLTIVFENFTVIVEQQRIQATHSKHISFLYLQIIIQFDLHTSDFEAVVLLLVAR